MRLPAPASTSHIRIRGFAAVLIAIAVGILFGVLDIAPVRSQLLTLDAVQTSAAVPIDDPWAAVWDDAPSQNVPLSEQNLVFPFGGGAVASVTMRALFDDDQIYLTMEWADTASDDAVNGIEAFSDAAALQFPGVTGATPPFTMGSAGQPVNIWQWKAVWQKDIEDGFATSRSRYPDTYVDFYPNEDDPIYAPAASVGNPVAQRVHSSPVENLIAEGFGTLTNSEIQDVAGSGRWQDGTWRVLFARPLEASADGLAQFAPGRSTQVAVAVWDGGFGDRNGQKSIAQFLELRIGDAADVTPDTPTATTAAPSVGENVSSLGVPSDDDSDIPWIALAVILAALTPFTAMIVIAVRGRNT